MVSVLEVEELARKYAKRCLEERVRVGKAETGTYSANFEPVLYLIPKEGEPQVLLGFLEEQRMSVIRFALKQFPNTQTWVLCYDGLMSQFEAGECVECLGEAGGCEACSGTGKQRKGGKRDAIVTVRGERGSADVVVNGVFYTTIGGRVLTEPPFSPNAEPDYDRAASKHAYREVLTW